VAASESRTLANLLATRDDASLATLLSARGVSPRASWSDAFDAAEDLLDNSSIARALADLTADEVDALVAAGPDGAVPAGDARDELIVRALADDAGRPWRVVAEMVATGGGAGTATSASAPASEPLDDPRAEATGAAEAERAFAAVGSVADILHAALAAPLARIGAGTLGATDRRRLIETGAVTDASAAEDLVAIAERAGLLAPEDRSFLVTEAGLTWLGSSTLVRWSDVAQRLLAALPRGVQGGVRGGGGWRPVADWPRAYPFDATWPLRATSLAALLRRWALVDAAGAPAPWMRAAAVGGTVDLDILAGLLPPEVDRVYLQNDLTAIAPGSLAPHLDMRLRTMARRESRAQASTYRFTAETLADALTAGETASSLREFLLALSLTGLPQPLAYEIERTASRHGTLRVGPDSSGRTRVSSSDDALLRTIAVDQALRPLGLVADGADLVTRSSPDTAFWMIADARYPVVAVDADGGRRALDRHRLASSPAPAADPVAIYADLIARLRAADQGDADAAWLGRELEQSVRARATLIVTVRLPDGSERDFTIEATGLGGGRLRGLDRTVDVERTLPVSSIVRVRPA